MTREEAIEFIAQSVKSDVDMAKVADAIKALEQEPSGDAISRQAALRQAINAHKMAQENGFDFKDICEEYLNVLPSVNPQEPCGDAISRQAVLDLIEHYNSDALGTVFIDYEHGKKLDNEVQILPSVTPTQNCVENALGALDCISRQGEIIRTLMRWLML